MFRAYRTKRAARLAAVALAVTAAFAATGQIINTQQARRAAASDHDLMKLDLRANRSVIVAEMMPLSASEAEAFLPVYLDYDTELQNIWNERLKLIAQYASEYDGITDAQAGALAVAMLDIDGDLVKLRKKYYRQFENAVGGRAAARFLQVDRRLNNLLELQASQSIPLVH